MKGYFACPILVGRNCNLVSELVLFIESLGHQILDRHVIFEMSEMRGEMSKNSGIPVEDIDMFAVRKQDLEWVDQAEFMILEFTAGSWGGGIEFHQATVVRKILGKELIPILCLIKEIKKGSGLIRGIDSQEFPKVVIAEYKDLDEAKNHILKFFKHTLQ